MAGSVRINRYLAAAGLGTRREVEGLLRTGRVTIAGEGCTDPSRRVSALDEVLVDGLPPGAGPTGAVVHRGPDAPLEIVHPGVLHAVLPLEEDASGLELLLADADLARRLSDPRFPLGEVRRGRQRTKLGGIDLGSLEPGEWRPLAPRELAKLRRGARLPPTAG